MMEYIALKAQYRALKEQIDENIENVINNAEFIMGSQVSEFENELAEYAGVKHVISCSDGTAALQLIYMAYGIGAGDAVFCPDMTFIASIEPACLLGATPVFCEIDEQSYNISPTSLERQINNVISEGKLSPRAVVAVDFLGNPADFDEIRKITDRYGMLLIEDAAQGMGGIYKRKKCGSLGDVAATSFFPSKPLGCYGDGGAVFTNDDELDKKFRSLRVHGKGTTKYDNVAIGINSRLDTIQAAVLLTKLRYLENEMNVRQEIAAVYDRKLSPEYVVPVISEECRSAYAQYVLETDSMEKRNSIMSSLKNHGIPSIMYYPTPMHMLPVFKDAETYGEDFSVAVHYSQCSFGIPFSAYLSEGEQKEIVNELLF